MSLRLSTFVFKGRGFLKATTPLGGSSRDMTSAEFKEKEWKPKPFPYKTRNYNTLWQWLDKTTLRFDENTKIIVVDGAHSIGKSKLAQHIAKEFGMVYMPQLTLEEEFLTTSDGGSFRDYSEHFMPRAKPFAEKDFVKNPRGDCPGCADRFLYHTYLLKFQNYFHALRHLFNTGEGIVIEGNPFSDYIQIEAAYRAGFIDKMTLEAMKKMHQYKNFFLLRPNLIIHLDADLETVKNNVKKAGQDDMGEKSLWNETAYLNDLYGNMKHDYLREAKKKSLVLMYDWNEEGDKEVVVEDIERLNFDWYDFDDSQQSDWKMGFEFEYQLLRKRFTTREYMNTIFYSDTMAYTIDCDQLYYNNDEMLNLYDVMAAIPSEKFSRGFNPSFGDKCLFKLRNADDEYKFRLYRRGEHTYYHKDFIQFAEN